MVLHSAGCSKDAVLDGYNRMLQHWGKYGLTGAGDLTGVKTPGEDSYTGSYTAAYDCFSDAEPGANLHRVRCVQLGLPGKPPSQGNRCLSAASYHGFTKP